MLILATGTSGTIGKHLSNRVCPVPADLMSFESITNSLKNFNDHGDSSLIHLAGVVGKIKVEKNVDHSRKINIYGTEILAENFKKNFLGKFYYISTSHVYASSNLAIDEECETKPSTLYASQKLEAEELLIDMFSDSPERLCILRLFSVLDWDTAPFTLGGGIRKLTDNDSNFKLQYSNDVRDFLTPRKFAETILNLVDVGTASGVVNVCSNVGTQIFDACTRMLSESNFKIPYSRIVSGNSDDPIIIGNNSRLLHYLPNLVLDWKPSRISDQSHT
jgi:nucleoside-diphosphate-sugar epimerase